MPDTAEINNCLKKSIYCNLTVYSLMPLYFVLKQMGDQELIRVCVTFLNPQAVY